MPSIAHDRPFAIRAAATLAALALVPICAFVALDGWSARHCASVTSAEGELGGGVAWRISRAECAGAAEPFYDVSIGARGRALATAATSQGAPVPVAVRRLAGDEVGVELDRPWRGETIVPIRLRRTGSPAERVDLGAAAP